MKINSRTKKLTAKDMTEGTPWKLILGFALPLMFGNVFQQIYTFVDTLVVGQVLGMNALAAIGVTEWAVLFTAAGQMIVHPVLEMLHTPEVAAWIGADILLYFIYTRIFRPK